MNAERLHLIATETNAAFGRAGVLTMLAQLVTDVTNRLNSPTDRTWDARISTDLKKLLSAVDALGINTFPPTWRKILGDLGLGVLLPDNFRQRIDDAFLQ